MGHIGEWQRGKAQSARPSVGEPRSETTYLNIIGAVLELMLSESPGGQTHSVFKNHSAVISALLARHEGSPGFSLRTLEEKFAIANRTLAAG
jgi:hypothetical protein